MLRTGSVNISGCTFLNLNALKGGAIYISEPNSSFLIIDSTTFNGNSASQGGAIFSGSNSISVIGSFFTNNQASIGGAMFVDSQGMI